MSAWEWSVEGTRLRSSPGSMAWSVSENGKVEAEGSGDALAELLQRGPFWDGLDQDEEVTITLRPLPGGE